MSIRAIIFDLDDTLYPETDYVKSGFSAVGAEMERRFPIKDAYKKLIEYFSADRRDVYGRVLRDCGVTFDERDIADFVNIYRTHRPAITLSPEVKETLSILKARGYKLGILTDGRPHQQRAKLEALGLYGLVDAVVVTDELGGEAYRKPNPAAFEAICERLAVLPEEAVYVGDNPEKDFAIKQYLRIMTVRVLSNGLYSDGSYSCGIGPDMTIKDVSALTEILFKSMTYVQDENQAII